MEERRFFDQLADLAIRVGTNLQPGQELVVLGDVEHSPLVRAVMEAGWRADASDVYCAYREPYDRLMLGRYGEGEQLGRSTFLQLALVDHLAQGQSAVVIVDGEAEPDLCNEVAPERMARIVPVEWRRRQSELLARQGVAWVLVPFPTAAWASRVFGEPDLRRLRDAIGRAMRLDEPDPVAAWQTHVGTLADRAQSLTVRGYDGLRFRGPETDLFIGLLPNAQWGGGVMRTSWGQPHVPNLPTEEVATTPDFRRTEGIVTTTLPFADDGAYVPQASFRFEGGRLVSASATEGEGWLRQMLATDDGASRLAEVALVPAQNRLSDLGLTFFHRLFDENISSHMAFGDSYTEGVPGSERLSAAEREATGMSTSLVHYDFMIGGSNVDVLGIRKDGTEEVIMAHGDWVLAA